MKRKKETITGKVARAARKRAAACAGRSATPPGSVPVAGTAAATISTQLNRGRGTKLFEPPACPSVNPLFDLGEEERSKLFVWLRECPYRDAVRQMLRDRGLPEVSDGELDDFFKQEADHHWEVRTSRAADEADALIRLAEKSVPKFSAGILAALGQEAFRQIASGNVDPSSMGRLATLFLKARSDERVDQMQELKREKLAREMESTFDQALEKLAEEVERHPAARVAFEALRRELAGNAEDDG